MNKWITFLLIATVIPVMGLTVIPLPAPVQWTPTEQIVSVEYNEKSPAKITVDPVSGRANFVVCLRPVNQNSRYSNDRGLFGDLHSLEILATDIDAEKTVIFATTNRNLWTETMPWGTNPPISTLDYTLTKLSLEKASSKLVFTNSAWVGLNLTNKFGAK